MGAGIQRILDMCHLCMSARLHSDGTKQVERCSDWTHGKRGRARPKDDVGIESQRDMRQ